MLIASTIAAAQPTSRAQGSPPAATTPTRPVPAPHQLNLLIRTTLIAVNQANFTGNYSVLRDLGTPQFQAANSDARLAELFAPLRRRNVDLSPILFFDPELIREPTLDADGTVRVKGFIPTNPERVLFDMGFAPVGGHWRLAAIVIDLQRQPPQAPTSPKMPTSRKDDVSGSKPATALRPSKTP